MSGAMRIGFVAFLSLALAMVFIGSTSGSSSASVEYVRVFIDLPGGYGAQEDSTIRAVGGRTRHLFSAQGTNTISAELPEQVVTLLANHPRFSFIRPVPDMEVTEDTLPWGVDRIDAEVVW